MSGGHGITLVIAAAGGLGREVAGYAGDAIAAGRLKAGLRGFLDDSDADPAAFGVALPVLGAIDSYRPLETDRVVVAVGAPADRAAIVGRLMARGARFASIIHPLAWVARPSEIGEGCVIAPFATIGMNARLGPHCLINTHAGIGHDAELEACCVVSPHAVVNGGAALGHGVLIGSAAVVTPRRRVGGGAQVSAGSVVQSDVPGGVTVWGNPARIVARP
ncbi:NeuD/PglB/VioB family sugar acetyltransferase [Magnetospirillum sp. SS-4]|uniref:NeuD/PglB/VioB family sugar acetyltransferase n=1 Tax=Magnetospirillum sp. SS-4 TaxID=2681465 RepID=UPI00137E6165|nr:NeuD/PglB/VioB family sugar acetyltransferase [Magnetospirillum sp. SS-4]CAA7625707.1 putative bacterial transferase, hexapeptide repeat protein [Magnetospirillum sp. SS-4]